MNTLRYNGLGQPVRGNFNAPYEGLAIIIEANAEKEIYSISAGYGQIGAQAAAFGMGRLVIVAGRLSDDAAVPTSIDSVSTLPRNITDSGNQILWDYQFGQQTTQHIDFSEAFRFNDFRAITILLLRPVDVTGGLSVANSMGVLSVRGGISAESKNIRRRVNLSGER